MAHYSKLEYWDDRYSKDSDPYDWYERYSDLTTILKEYMQPQHQILHIGCGNSRLTEEMYNDNFHNITSIDFSTVAIKQMIEKSKAMAELKFIAMDTRKLEFANNSFEVVIDKGTLDSILCGDNATANSDSMLKEIQRVLADGGVYICISFGYPDIREAILKKQQWEITTKTVNRSTQLNQKGEKKEQFHYIYICKKTAPTKAETPKQVTETKEAKEEAKKEEPMKIESIATPDKNEKPQENTPMKTDGDQNPKKEEIK
jgi:ubiquinone/menaquinone biosynthesis C-methylase UbiE